MKKILNPPRQDWTALCSRPSMDTAALENTVLEVFNKVQNQGDEALKHYTEKFDGVQLDQIEMNPALMEAAADQLSDALKAAIQQAYSNIFRFHEAQRSPRLEVETTEGVQCWQEKRPIEKVGLYIPGGTAPLFSTVLMLAIPAQIAGCREIVLCTPPNKEGDIHPAILYTAALCGVQRIFRLGGIQAIAAMTFGTESVPGVYKIFGPGNQFVTVAKQLATRFDIAIDMPAGPSELLVMADSVADPKFLAADLLSQAEHGPDSQVVLVSTEESLLNDVEIELQDQLRELPRRSIAEAAIDNSLLIYFKEDKDARDFINEYGPEHYILCHRNEDFYLNGLSNAGSVFIGNYTPESAGDYASGTNHTLPTKGYTKQYSGVNLDSFTKSITFQKISKDGLRNIGKSIETMASAEGLEAHRKAVSIRLKSIEREA